MEKPKFQDVTFIEELFKECSAIKSEKYNCFSFFCFLFSLKDHFAKHIGGIPIWH